MKFHTVLLALTTVFGASTICASTNHDAPAATSVVSEISWMTDFEAAKSLAKEQSKPLFLYFTGSDWCPWCIKMNTQILSTPEFAQALSQKMIFVKVDFPRQTKLDKATKEQNDKLSKTFGVQGFPTVILLDSDGQRIEKLSFQAGGGAVYAKKVLDILEQHAKKSAG